MCINLHRERVLQLSCFTCTAVSVSDNIQVPEAFPHRTQYLLPAGSSGCPIMHDVMPGGFCLTLLHVYSGGRIVPISQSSEMAFRKRSNPCWWSSRALQVSPHYFTGPWRFSGPMQACAACGTHFLSAESWAYMTGHEGTRSEGTRSL